MPGYWSGGQEQPVKTSWWPSTDGGSETFHYPEN